jgi:thioredoxin-related protein
MNRVFFNAKEIGENYHVEGYPAFFILDDTGLIINQIRGYSDENETIIFEEINKLIKL